MVDYLTPAPTAELTPTPGYLADILHVELSVGDRTDTTYGTDMYGSWDYGGKYAWVRWDCDITSLQIFRGRQSKLERNSPGVCTFTAVQIVPSSWLTNPPAARPGRVVTSTGQIVFEGVIEAATLSREYGSAEWSVTIVDDLARLGRLEIATLTRPAEPLGVRMDALLVAAGMVKTNRSWEMYVQPVAGSGRKVLDELGIALDSWRWESSEVARYAGSSAFVDRTGAFMYTDATMPYVGGSLNTHRNYLYPWRVSPTPAAHAYNVDTWLGDALHIEFSADTADIRNQLTFSNAGGTATTTENTASVATYGPRSYQRMDLIAQNAPAGPSAGWTADKALTAWHTNAMDPTPAVRVKSVTIDCWNRPAGAIPLESLLANIDISHVCELALPDQDDAGGDIAVQPAPPPTFVAPGTGNYIYGITWELGPREALLTLAMDAPIKRTA